MASNWEWREALASVKDEVEALMLEYPWLVVCTVVVVLLSPLLWMCLRKRNKGEYYESVLFEVRCSQPIQCIYSYM